MKKEQELVNKLTNKHYTISTAESCTGGLLSATIVNVSGASNVFNCGFVTYANEAKERMVHVNANTLQKFGAVSEETAQEMAIGCAKEAGAQMALSTTGIAGPSGGTPEKPVGLIYIGCYINGETYVKECRFQGNREENRNAAVEATLELLFEMLSKKD